MFSVIVKGFPTKEAAEAWVGWYEGQGEQDVSTWMDEQLNARTSANTDCQATYPLEWDNDTVELFLNVTIKP